MNTALQLLRPLASTRPDRYNQGAAPGTIARAWVTVGVSLVSASLLAGPLVLAGQVFATWATLSLVGLALLVQVGVVLGTALGLQRLVTTVQKAEVEDAEDLRLERLELTGRGSPRVPFDPDWLPSGWRLRVHEGKAAKTFRGFFRSCLSPSVEVEYSGEAHFTFDELNNSLTLADLREIASVAELMAQWGFDSQA